jgi:two-component system response regulator PfeR
MDKPRLLLVDDEPLIQAHVASMVRRLGYAVAVAETGQEAVQLARDIAFDVAIIDFRLPEMDGLETLAELQRLRPGIAAILFSGAVTAEMEERTRAAGAHTLEKPFVAAALDALLREILARGS